MVRSNKSWRKPPETRATAEIRPTPTKLLKDAGGMRVGNTIYLDHQASTPTDGRVIERMMPFFAEAFGNPHSSDHAMGWSAAEAVEAAAGDVATLIGADGDEIVFTSGATEANNLALFGLAQGTKIDNRNRVLISATEHKSILAAARELGDRFGYAVEVLPVDGNGIVPLSVLEKKLSEDVLLLSIAHVNNEIGTVSAVDQIGLLASSVGALLHCDCAQSAGAVDISNLAQSVDLASLSGHKMYGPKGIGALFVRREIQHRIHPQIHGGGQQRHLRSGTLPTPLCVGMGVAAQIARSSFHNIAPQLQSRRDRLVNGLSSVKWKILLNGQTLERRHPGNANLQFVGFSADEILGALQPRIAASTGSACASGVPEPSHVLRAIGLSAEQANASIRFSVGRHTTVQDIDEAIDLIDAALSRLSKNRV